MDTIIKSLQDRPQSKKRFTSKSFFYMLLILFWSRDFLCNYIRAFALRIPLISIIADYIIPIIMLICIIFSLPYIISRIRVNDFFCVVAFFLVFCINWFLFKDNQVYMIDLSYSLWVTVVPLYFIGLQINSDKVVRILYIVSLINLWSFFAYFILFGVGMNESQALFEGAMNRAYNLLPHISLISIFALSKPNIVNIVTFLVSAIYLIACGTRGAVVCLVLFLIFYVLFLKRVKEHPFLYSIIGSATVAIIIFFDEIIMLLTTFSKNTGMSWRVLSRLSEGTFLHSSGRNIISEKLLLAISENPIIGYGIAGDRVLAGIYAHNLVLELWVSYGVIIGTTLIIGVVYILFKGVRRSNNQNIKAFILLLICCSIAKLFVTGSYLSEELFFFLLGICVTQIRSRKYLDETIVAITD